MACKRWPASSVMACKQRRSETLPQSPVFRFSLDAQFQAETEKEAFTVADPGISKGGFIRFGAVARRRIFASHAHFYAKKKKKHSLLRVWVILQVYSQIFVRGLFEWHAVRISIIGRTVITVDT